MTPTTPVARVQVCYARNEDCMGHVYADIELANARRPDLPPVRVRALADTGAHLLCIPEHVAVKLRLETKSTRDV